MCFLRWYVWSLFIFISALTPRSNCFERMHPWTFWAATSLLYCRRHLWLVFGLRHGMPNSFCRSGSDDIAIDFILRIVRRLVFGSSFGVLSSTISSVWTDYKSNNCSHWSNFFFDFVDSMLFQYSYNAFSAASWDLYSELFFSWPLHLFDFPPLLFNRRILQAAILSSLFTGIILQLAVRHQPNGSIWFDIADKNFLSSTSDIWWSRLLLARIW